MIWPRHLQEVPKMQDPTSQAFDHTIGMFNEVLKMLDSETHYLQVEANLPPMDAAAILSSLTLLRTRVAGYHDYLIELGRDLAWGANVRPTL